MSSLALTPILQAIRTLLSVNTLDNAKKLASTVGLMLIEPSSFQIVEHITKKGKAIRGVVRTDLSYGEAKAIDEYTFKKDGGWFIREKYLGLESQSVTTQQTPTETPQNEPVAVVESDTLVSDDDNNIKALELKFKPASQKYKKPEIKLDTKEGVKLLKKTLTKLFPDTKFSVTMARGTAYGSAYVSWVDGASYDLVNVIAQHFKGSGFDGMSDSSYSLYALNEDGKVIDYGLGYVSISRGYSRDFLEKLQSSFSDMLQNMIKQEGVTIKGDGFNAYFDAKERWTQDKINEAKISHSSGKYNFGGAPQAANDEPVTTDKPQEFLAGLLKNAQEKENVFVDDEGKSHKKIEKSVMGKFLPWQYNKYRELFGIARTVTITSTEEKYEGINLTGKYASESNNYYAFSIRYEPVADFELSSQSESERLAKEAEIKLLEQQKRDQEEKARLKAQADKELNDFRLTGSSLPSDVAASYGQGDMFVSTRSQTNQPSLMQDTKGLDPTLKDMVKEYYDLVHGTYVDKKLADPTLEAWERKEYQQVKDDNIKRKDELEKHLNETVLKESGIDWTGFYKQLSPTNEAPPTYTPKGENNVSTTSGNLESDSNTASQSNQQPRVENGNANESAESQRVVGSPVNGLDARGGGERDSGLSLSENDGTGIGARSDTGVSGKSGQRGAGDGVTTNESSGSDSTDGQRSPIKRERDRSIVRIARATGTITADAKEAEQLKAEGTPTQWANAQNIDKALPYLLPEQRGDVALAEKRLIDDNKNGMLFTNGTGTGKTFTGLGIVKRFANAGKKNILIVSMNDKIIKDFIKSAKKLALNIHQLDGIADNGKDKIIATTYANLAQNDTLGMRDWDLIIVDEAHNLMQGEKGENTNALAKLRALSGHHAGFSEWVKMRHADKDPKPIGESPETGLPIYNQDEVSAWEAFKKPLREQWQKTWAEQPKGRTKVIFLSATPFSYVKTLDWAEGYLFDFVPPADKFSNKTDAMGSAYNSGGAQERFYMNNFGYKMRNNRLTRPDSKVDVGILERKFAEKLKKEGAMSGRELSVPFDYDRKFVLISSKVGEKIDEGFNYLWDTKDKDGKSKYSDLLRAINKRFDYLARLQLLEAIKAQEAIEQIKKHLALGRKVIVFHDFNEGGTTNPFVMKGFSGDDASAVEAQYNDFKRERPDLINLKLDIPAPLVTLRKVFPNALLFNGRVAKGQRAKNADLFNSDDSGLNLMIAQSDAAATGISFHDTTGKHQRVILNIGMPTKPAKLRQTEGRIYRVGQASNAIQRYLTTGTNWERSAFAQKIAERAETVDNLAQGESAVVSIKDALVRAYESAEYFEPSLTDGVGGKAYDEENNRVMALSPFERAKTEYWVKQKVTAKRGEREGKEWYATPEPVGLFMVNLAGAHSGDDVLEPSAGDGAIGRYMPSDASVTFIEPTDSLASRARMNNTNANVIVDTFENHNSSNKYDAIVMNPPFGQGGSIAIKHLIKAFEHLRDGGRVVALLPVGKMDELIAKYQDNGYFKDIYTVAEFTLPGSTFENAGTRVNTKIHVFEKHENKADAPQGVIVKDLSHYDDISRLFDAIENISIKPRKPRLDEALAEYGIAVYPNRSKYIVTGEGVKRKDIVRALFSTFDTPNADGDYVDQYNRSKLYLQVLKREGIPTMAQFNQGLSANNLPIKYQQHNNKFNTWDGVGDMPDWVRGAIRYGGKLEDFAVEKPVYNSLDHYNSINPDYSITNIMGLIKSLANKKDDTLAGELAKAVGLKIVKPLNPDDIKQIDKTLTLPENATKGDRKRAIKNWLRPFLGKHIKTSDGKVVVVNSADSMWHLSYNGNRNDLKAKVVPYVFDVLAFGEFIGREDLSHERKDDFIAFHVYRKWCEVEGKQVYLEAHAGERENGVIELVVYNQKLAIKKNEGSLGTLKSSNEDQVPKYALDNHNNTIFDDTQVSDDLAVEDGDLVRILEIKELTVNEQNQPKKKIRTYGWNRYLMYQNLTNEELQSLVELTRLKHRTNKNGIYLYDKQGQKKLDDLSWIQTWRIKDNDEAKFGKLLDHKDVVRIKEEVKNDFENNHYNSIDDAAHQAATSPHNDLAEPTDAQKLAGNYKTGKININGLAISIENPQGSTRSGVNAEGKEWSNTMQHHYGYINGTEGADGDHLDVFVVPGISEDYQGSVFIIDQVEPLTGDFDEHKIIIGANSHKAAKKIYLANYDADWQGFGDSTELTMSEFKDWLKNGDLTRPISHEFEDRYNDIGGFNFIPAISFDDTLNAIKALMANNSEDNAQRLAMLTGLRLQQTEPDIDVDMFGEPVNQGFDLFGEPIQDGDESPVEELPRLAVVELPLEKLTLSEDVPQFKSGADGESGVVEALGGKFDRTGVAPIQVWERTDGRLEIISGRHRTDLARRSGEKTIPAQVHKESEGFTAKQAMMLDAELNIRDGQGKVKDYVDYFTHSEISEDEAERRSLIARSIGQRAFIIASQGSEELKTLHRNDIISDQAAAEIASIAPKNSAMQAVGLRVLQEHKPLNNALNTIRAVQALTREKGQEPDTFDLFGFDDSALKEAEAMARIASRKQRQIAEQLNAIKGAVKNPKLAARHGVVVENEADALAKVQTMTAQKARWDNWSSHADLLAEVRAELADSHNSAFDDDDYWWFCQEELDVISI